MEEPYEFSLVSVTRALADLPFRAISTHPICESLSTYTLPLPSVPAYDLQPDNLAFPSMQGFKQMNEIFISSFCKRHPLPSWRRYNRHEQAAMALAIFEESIMSFVANCLMEPEVPITTNMIIFLLDCSIKVTDGRPGFQQLITAIQTLQKVKTWTRAQVAGLLCEVRHANWLTTAWAGTLINFLERYPRLAESTIYTAWLPYEPLGSYWIETYSTLHLWTMSAKGTLLPVVFPSFIAHQMWELMRQTKPDARIMPIHTYVNPEGMDMTPLSEINMLCIVPCHFMLPSPYTILRHAGDDVNWQLLPPTRIDMGPSIEVYNRTLQVRYESVPIMMSAHNDATNWGSMFMQYWRDSRTQFLKSKDTRMGDVASHQEDSDIGSLSDSEFPIICVPD